MSAPINNGNISISQEVQDYQGAEPRRLCLQRLVNGLWEVQFARQDEANLPSWRRPGWVMRALNWARTAPPAPERVLLDATLSHEEPTSPRECSSDLFLSGRLLAVDRSVVGPHSRLNTVITGLVMTDERIHFLTPEARTQLSALLSAKPQAGPSQAEIP